MKKHSTLIYFVTNFQAEETASNEIDQMLGSSLTKMDIEPSEKSIINILYFARSYEVIVTKNAGHIEMILNHFFCGLIKTH